MNLTDTLTQYYQRVKNANTEQAKKEILFGLLIDLFGKDDTARQIIHGLQEGSEGRVENIPLKHRNKIGAADSLYRSLIIEFEKDLRKTGPHAADQLAEYYAGNWKSGFEYEFTLIATDCLTWVVYCPIPSAAESIEKVHHVDRRLLTVVEEFTLTLENVGAFPSFLDRFLFRLTPERATINSVVRVFGDGSLAFMNAVHGIRNIVSSEIESSPALQIAFSEWERLLQVAYGNYKGDLFTFSVHTYLSMLSKMLAYQVLTGDAFIDDDELHDILTGDMFARYNVADFVERDFFGWITVDTHRHRIIDIGRRIADSLSDLDFKNVSEDVLKGVYQNLIDVETRHDLGEYYTPDWLCEKIVEHLEPYPGQTMLDPACGSGSFIRAYNHYLLCKYPDVDVSLLSMSTYGVDVNPLSVQIAKATKLVSLGQRVKSAERPVRLNIFLANALYTPEEYLSIWSAKFRVMINDDAVHLTSDMFTDIDQFDRAIDLCDRIADATVNTNAFDLNTFAQRVRANLDRPLSEEHAIVYHQLYSALRHAKVIGKDSIWRFILQNIYKPTLLKAHFDFVLGNPPWLTYRQINSADYQDIVREIATRYHMTMTKKKNLPHMELAVIFLAHSVNYFMRKAGRGAFVMPRSVMTADQHSQLRSGRKTGFAINEIWDLNGVDKLFPVPSCVLFFSPKPSLGESDEEHTDDERIVTGKQIIGKLPEHNVSLQIADSVLSDKDVEWQLKKLNYKTSYALLDKKIERSQFNFYRKAFRQGATITPRSCMFVEVVQGTISRDDSERKMVYVATSSYAQQQAKKQWKGIKLNGRVPLSLIYYTPLANSVFPYAIVNPSKLVLPVKRLPLGSANSFKLVCVTSDDLMKNGDIDGSEWFRKAETLWENGRTEKSAVMNLQQRIDYQSGLSQQLISYDDYYVCYNASGKDACAGIVVQADYERPVVFDAKTYWMRTSNEEEALYVLAHLNSDYANETIKSFQSHGLFGARDIHTAILEVGLRQYDRNNRLHSQIVELTRKCANQSKSFLSSVDMSDIQPNQLGRIRAQLRKILADARGEIDRLLSQN